MDDDDYRPMSSAEWLEFGEGIEDKSLDRALTHYRRAWDELPKPKEKQKLAIQILAAIADCEFQRGSWEACQDALKQALEKCGLPEDSPFARLRMGQCHYELGNVEDAATWLVPVYLKHGREPFEDEDPKYLDFFQFTLQPPEGGWPKGW